MPRVIGKRSELLPSIPIKERAYLGVDPGTQGGMTIIGKDGRPKGFLDFGSATEHQIAEWILKMNTRFDLKAVIEQVHAMPKQGVTSMFTFGKSLGFIRGVIVGAKIPFVEISAMKWQNFFSIPKRKEKSKTDHKKILQARAHQQFPAYVKDISRAVADSVLIAEWLRTSLLEQRIADSLGIEQ